MRLPQSNIKSLASTLNLRLLHISMSVKLGVVMSAATSVLCCSQFVINPLGHVDCILIKFYLHFYILLLLSVVCVRRYVYWSVRVPKLTKDMTRVRQLRVWKLVARRLRYK